VKRLVIFLMLQFLAVSVKKFTDLWDVAPCCLVEIQHTFGVEDISSPKTLNAVFSNDF